MGLATPSLVHVRVHLGGEVHDVIAHVLQALGVLNVKIPAGVVMVPVVTMKLVSVYYILKIIIIGSLISSIGD